MVDKLKNWWVFPGFELELAASGFDLPVNLAFVSNLKKSPNSPLLYVTELYGQVKVITNDWKIQTYAKNLLNFEPSKPFLPGMGESGVTGICMEPKSGDLFVSMIYLDGKKMKNKVIRTTSRDGITCNSQTVVIDNILSVHAAHQIQSVSIGFDEKLYVNIGDGMDDPMVAQNDNDLRGKILRLNLDGSIPKDNPNPKSYVFAKGVRNPFGANWRKSDHSLYITDNGPNSDDRIAKIEAGKNYGWPMSMRQNSIFWWEFTQAPTALAFMQDGQFPKEYNDELFVSLFGYAYHEGRQIKGKKIVKMRLNKNNDGVESYDEFLTYIGEGPASPCGLAFGPGGLYFTDLHGENGAKGKPDGNIYRIKPIK